MNIIERNVGVRMATENLSAAPKIEMPAGFSMRWFRAGDEKIWVAVQQAAEKFQPIDEALFWNQYGDDFEKLSQRIGFLVNSTNDAIGTISAWNDSVFNGREYGRIHWVAIMPEWQGRGLGRVMMSAACQRLFELGHDRAYLVTSTARVPAINLYLQFGFAPAPRNDEERAAWQELQPHLNSLDK